MRLAGFRSLQAGNPGDTCTSGIRPESNEDLQPLAVAKLLKALVDREQPQLVILGKQWK
ncbi:hypothetical protein OKW35_005092 [Paraburkholderia sp. MM5477-R1]